LYPSPEFTWAIKSRRLRWVGHVPFIKEMRNAFIYFFGIPEDACVDDRIMLE
jgi:hypothetical protein